MAMLSISPKSRATIPVSVASFSGHEREYVLDCLNRGWITQGYYVQRFEESFAELCGVKHAIACSSGTAALHLAMLVAEITDRHAVIVPALTYVATANTARYCGADVRFCDIDPVSWCIDYESASGVYDDIRNDGKDLGAVIPVHLYDAVACGFGTWDREWVVCDSSQALPIGMPSRSPLLMPPIVSAYSFYASKVIACGEGGMLVTNSDGIAESARLYRGQGATTPGRYHHSVVGYNYRMTDLQAAVGLAQLEQLPQNLAHRRAVIDRYRVNLVGESRITLQGGERASGWMMAVLLPEGRADTISQHDAAITSAQRDAVARRLREDGIETRPFFEPLPSLPMYRSSEHGVPPIAESVARRGLCLPTHTELEDGDIDYVCERLIAALGEEN